MLLTYEEIMLLDSAATSISLEHASSRMLPDLERVPGRQNWLEEPGVGGLPGYIKRIAKHLVAKGKTVSTAVATAVATVKRWASTGLNWNGSKVGADTRAKAAKAVAEWMAKRAAAKANNGSKKLKHSVFEEIELNSRTVELLHAAPDLAVARVLIGDYRRCGLRPPIALSQVLQHAEYRRPGSTPVATRAAGRSGKPIPDPSKRRNNRASRGRSQGGEFVSQPKPVAGGTPQPSPEQDAMAKAKKLIAADGKLRSKSYQRLGLEGNSPQLTAAEVKSLQKDLNQFGAGLKEDGDLGEVTVGAVQRYQQRNGLKPDGVPGARTKARLRQQARRARRASAPQAKKREPSG